MARTNKLIFAVGLIALGLILAAFGVAAVSPQGNTVTAATNAVGVESVSANIPMSLQASIDAASSGCTNAPGPQVTLSGELALGGLETKMIFQNNVQGTHTHEDTSTATAVVIPAGESISIPKQPAYGGTGGNPWIWLQFTDVNGKGGALTDPVDTAILLFRGTSPAVAERFASVDPYVENGLVKSWRVREWITVVGPDAEAPAKK